MKQLGIRISNGMKAAALTLGMAGAIAVGYFGTAGQSYIGRTELPAGAAAGERPEWDGSAWQARQWNDIRSTHLEHVTEFYGAGNDICNNVTSGTGAVSSGVAASGRPGVQEYSTGSTSTGRAGCVSSSIAHVLAGNASTAVAWTGGWATLSTSSEEYASIIGFFNSSTAIDQSTGCFVLYDRGNVATGGPNSGNASKLSCWCASAGTRTKYLMDGSTVSDNGFTTVNTPVAAMTLPDTNVYSVMVTVTGTTKAEFYVRDSGGAYTKRCEIATNLPTAGAGTGVGFNTIKSNGTGAGKMTVDRLRLGIDGVTARGL